MTSESAALDAWLARRARRVAHGKQLARAALNVTHGSQRVTPQREQLTSAAAVGWRWQKTRCGPWACGSRYGMPAARRCL